MRSGWLVLAALSFAAHIAQGQTTLIGRWQGYWGRAGDSLFVTLDVRADSVGGYAATFSSDRLRVSGIPFSEVRVQGCCDVMMTLRGDRTTMAFTGTMAADSLTGDFREGASTGRFAYSRSRRADPAFDEREVTFRSDSATLAGTIILPRAGDPVPGVVFLHGSGAEGRWASRFLALQLASRGIASLTFDKRGVGSSTGDWRRATLEDLASDGAAAVARLRQEPRVDSRRVGIHGHSQGGTLAPMVAVRATVAFVIGSAAAGLPTDSTELYSVLNSILPHATSARDSADAQTYTGELVAVAYHGVNRARLDSLTAAMRERPWYFAPPPLTNPYWFFSPMFARYQPLEWWSKIRVPVLLEYGADDQRVPAARSAERIVATLRRAGNRDVTVAMHPGADHTFRLPPGPSGWAVTAPGYVSGLLDWIAKRK